MRNLLAAIVIAGIAWMSGVVMGQAVGPIVRGDR